MPTDSADAQGKQRGVRIVRGDEQVCRYFYPSIIPYFFNNLSSFSGSHNIRCPDPCGALQPDSHASTVLVDTPITAAKSDWVKRSLFRMLLIFDASKEGTVEMVMRFVLRPLTFTPFSWVMASLSPLMMLPYTFYLSWKLPLA